MRLFTLRLPTNYTGTFGYAKKAIPVFYDDNVSIIGDCKLKRSESGELIGDFHLETELSPGLFVQIVWDPKNEAIGKDRGLIALKLTLSKTEHSLDTIGNLAIDES